MTAKDNSQEGHNISLLNGIDPTTVDRLRKAGITTVFELLTHTPMEIAERTGIGREFAARIASNAREQLANDGYVNKVFGAGSEFVDMCRNIDVISTGCDNFDAMLQGNADPKRAGIETGTLTGIFGECGTGKTQTVLKLAVMAQLPKNRGGLDTNVIFIDCNGDYHQSADCITTMGKSVGLDESVKKRITHFEPDSLSTLDTMLNSIEKILAEGNTRLVLIDGSMMHCGVHHDKQTHERFLPKSHISKKLLKQIKETAGTYRKRQHEKMLIRSDMLWRLVRRIKKIAWTYSVAIVITNQLTEVSNEPGYPALPYEGETLAQIAAYNVRIRKDGQRSQISIFNSPRHSREEYEVWFTDTGPADEPARVQSKLTN